jgi:hypothetical protein
MEGIEGSGERKEGGKRLISSVGMAVQGRLWGWILGSRMDALGWSCRGDTSSAWMHTMMRTSVRRVLRVLRILEVWDTRILAQKTPVSSCSSMSRISRQWRGDENIVMME